MRVAVIALALVASVGCSSSSPKPSPSPSASPSATGEASTSPSTSPAASASSAPSTPRCHTADLSAASGGENGAAGTTYVEITFTNHSSAPCTLDGYPGVSLVDSSGSVIGQPATRNTSPGPALVTLDGGGKAHANVGFPNPGNFSSGQCSSVESVNMRVYPPDETQSLLVAIKKHWCPGFSLSAIAQ